MNFIAGRIGSAVGGSMFNKQTSSCDVFDKNGNPCCADKKEARKNEMPYCKTGQVPKKKK